MPKGSHVKAPAARRIPSLLAGVAGEYLVAGELSRRGWLASITLRNTRGVDVLVTNAEVTRSLGIQVKTSQAPRAEWILNHKAESIAADNLFYVFVRLNGLEQPLYHIVPSRDVAEQVRRSHEQWLATPGRKGQQHQATDARLFTDAEGEYLGRWDLLGL